MQPLGKPLVLALFACNSKTGYMISISRYIFLENFGKKSALTVHCYHNFWKFKRKVNEGKKTKHNFSKICRHVWFLRLTTLAYLTYCSGFWSTNKSFKESVFPLVNNKSDDSFNSGSRYKRKQGRVFSVLISLFIQI